MGRVKALPTILGWVKVEADSTAAMVGLGDIVGLVGQVVMYCIVLLIMVIVLIQNLFVWL